MSESLTAHAAAGDVAQPESQGSLFEADELSQFDDDDVTAGRAICKMLSWFFLYTVIAMSLVGWWTFSSVFG